MCKGKLFLLFCLLFLFAVLVPVFTSESNIINYETQSKPPEPENYSEDSEPLPGSLSELPPPLPNPQNPWESLRNWISEGRLGLTESTESLTTLEKQLTETLAKLRAENSEQELLLTQSKELLTSLRQSLTEAQTGVDIAIDRMQDAEDYAFYIEAQNELLKQEIQRFRKSGQTGFAFGAVSFGAGAPLIIEGIRNDNKTMLYSGIGVTAVGSLVWITGRYVFNWW